MGKLDIINFVVNNMTKDPRQMDIEDFINQIKSYQAVG
jgi:hypothetical protein